MTERNGLVLLLLVSCQPSLNAYSLNLFCYVFVLFCSVFFSLIFQADTNSILFHLVVENLILHIFLIIMIIMPCSGMFWNVPECSGMFHVPGFIDAQHLYVDVQRWNAHAMHFRSSTFAYLIKDIP